jgi:hypothetical protein
MFYAICIDKADLKAEAEANGQLGQKAYKDLIDLENQLHALKMKNIETQKQAQSRGGNAPSNPNNSGSGVGGGSSSTSGTTTRGAGLGGGAPVVNNYHINLPDNSVMVATKRDLEDVFARIVLPGLKRAQELSVKPILGK